MKQITKHNIQNFKSFLTEEEKSNNTIEKYMRDVRFFAAWLSGREFDKSSVIEYKRELIEKYAPSSVNSMLSSLNAFFSYMNWQDLKVKTLKIQRQIFADCDRELTKSEYERLLAVAKAKKNEQLYYLMQTIASTGIRISELASISVEAVQRGQATINCKGKLRQVILPKTLCKMLTSYIKNQKIKSGSVFISRSGKPLDRSRVWKLLKSLCAKANVSKSKVFPHNLRHLFAKTFYTLHKDIVRLADILGHTSVNTTRIYTKETGEIHREQIDRLMLLRC